MTELPTVEHVAPKGQQASEAAGDILDLGAIHALARGIAALDPHARLRVRADPVFVRFDRAIDRGLDLALTRARARAFAVDLDLARDDLDLDRARDALDARALDALACARDALDRALHDFTKADLRDVDLTNVWLEGLRWSPGTRWPPGWVDQVERDSVEVAPGVFEVRRGRAHVPVPV